jgi:cytochrome P450
MAAVWPRRPLTLTMAKRIRIIQTATRHKSMKTAGFAVRTGADMTELLPEAALLPMTRRPGCPFDPPEELALLRERHPVSRLAFDDGHVGWLVTSHALVRAALADPRLSARHELMHVPFPGMGITELPAAPPGFFTALDPPEHTRFRGLLVGKFTVRRMKQLTARAQQIVADHLDAMERQGPPVDLVQAYAYPIPALMICELLGVPDADHGLFQRLATVNGRETPMEEQIEAMIALRDYVRELIVAKRAEPTDDLLSDLTSSDLTQEELENAGTAVLGGALDSTANVLALGVFALLSHPEQLAALRADPGIAETATDELLRYLTPVHTSVRAALDDFELGGHQIKAGQTVALALSAANRDPERFASPDTLDLNRRATAHVTFSHGIHQCLGQQLARVELSAAIPALVTRFPSLRLAIPPADIPLRDGSMYGVKQLPVTWDGA